MFVTVKGCEAMEVHKLVWLVTKFLHVLSSKSKGSSLNAVVEGISQYSLGLLCLLTCVWPRCLQTSLQRSLLNKPCRAVRGRDADAC